MKVVDAATMGMDEIISCWLATPRFIAQREIFEITCIIPPLVQWPATTPCRRSV
jgi:hypothetical protein